jgi:ABC-type proline/glycine betaine transport system permease subunit
MFESMLATADIWTLMMSVPIGICLALTRADRSFVVSAASVVYRRPSSILADCLVLPSALAVCVRVG